MSLIKKKVYVTQEMHDSMSASFKSAFIAIGVVATILVLLALYYHIRYKRASSTEDINKYKELRLNSALFLIPCAVASFLSLGCIINLGNMTMRFIHKIYKAGIHTIVHSNISCTERGVELFVEQRYPYVEIGDERKTIHPNEKCRKRAFSSDSAVVTADNYWTVYTILNQRIMNDLKSSDFWKNFKGND